MPEKTMAQSEGKEGILWGRHPVEEALKAGQGVSRIYFAREARGPQIERLKELARQKKVRFDFVEVGKLGHLACTQAHQDVVARLSPVQYSSLEQVLAWAGKKATVVMLDQVQNARNAGMVARTAAAAGALALVLPIRGGRLVNEEVARASAGGIFRLNVVPSANVVRDLEALKEEGFWVYGLEARGEVELFEVEWPERRVLVAGNEGRGLRPLVRKKVDALVRIPMAGGVESLNVAVALGVALFEGVRWERRS